MDEIGRRSAFTLGLAVAAAHALALPAAAAERTYGPNEGKELAPGVRLVGLGKSESTIPAYKTIEMVDFIFQPGSTYRHKSMSDDMVCFMPQGAVSIKKASKQFTVKEGEIYTCVKGEPEETTNTGSTVAVMRVIMLHAA